MTVSSKVKEILDLGFIGEQIARKIIKKFFKPKTLLQVDWLIERNNDWISIEVKHKNSFKYKGKQVMGLSIGQVISRMRLYKAKDIRCLLLFIIPDTKEVYTQWLDILEQTEYIDFPSKIRVYDKKEFKYCGKYEILLEETLDEIIDGIIEK